MTLQNLHYVTMFFLGVNVVMLARAVLRYGRFHKNNIPALNMCLIFLLSSLLYSVLMVFALLLPEGPLLRLLVLLAHWLTILGNILFAFVILELSDAGQVRRRPLRRLVWLVPAVALVLFATNGLHGQMVSAITKEADGFGVVIEPGWLNIPVQAMVVGILVYAIIRVFRAGPTGYLKEAGIRWLLVFCTAFAFLVNVVQAAWPLMAELQLNLLLVWVPMNCLCYIFFGYLLTARQLAIEAMNDAYVVFDVRGYCVDLNQRAALIFQRYCGAARPTLEQLGQVLALPEEDGPETEAMLRDEAGSQYYRVAPFHLSNGINQSCGKGYIIWETTDFMQKMSQLNLEAGEDPLTGAKNRRYLDQYAAMALARAAARGMPVTVLMLDLDHFKKINDHYGHAAGDEVLRGAARVFTGNVREDDLVFRYGGEEFVVLCEGADARVGMRLAERIRRAVEKEAFHTAGGDVGVTVSIGVYTAVPGPKDTAAAFIQKADQRMYAAKQAGRNRAVAE